MFHVSICSVFSDKIHLNFGISKLISPKIEASLKYGCTNISTEVRIKTFKSFPGIPSKVSTNFKNIHFLPCVLTDIGTEHPSSVFVAPELVCFCFCICICICFLFPPNVYSALLNATFLTHI